MYFHNFVAPLVYTVIFNYSCEISNTEYMYPRIDVIIQLHMYIILAILLQSSGILPADQRCWPWLYYSWHR